MATAPVAVLLANKLAERKDKMFKIWEEIERAKEALKYKILPK